MISHANSAKARPLMAICIENLRHLVYWEQYVVENTDCHLHDNKAITDEEIGWLERIRDRLSALEKF